MENTQSNTPTQEQLLTKINDNLTALNSKIGLLLGIIAIVITLTICGGIWISITA